MSVHRPNQPVAPAPAVPRASMWNLARTSLAVLLILCLPLSLLKQIDALVAYMRPARILWSCAVVALIVAAAAILFAVVARSLGWILARVCRRERADALAWWVLLTPCAVLALWQLVAIVRLWLTVVTGLDPTVSAAARMFALVALVAGSWVLLRRQAWARFVGALDGWSASALPVVVLALSASFAAVVVQPPRALHSKADVAGAPSASGKPDIILITIDTLSEVDANVCGPGPTLMPHLREFAGAATCFTHFYAASNFTVPTTSTIETGTLPWTHRAVQPGADIDDAVRARGSLAGGLHAIGYATAAIGDNVLASPRHHGTDPAYGIDELVPSRSLANTVANHLSLFGDANATTLLAPVGVLGHALDVYLVGERAPDDPKTVYDRGLDVLHGGALSHPGFLWLHTFPPHAPYLPPPSTRHRLLAAGQLESWRDFLPENVRYAASQQPLVDKHRLRYRESILGADEALGTLLSRLERDGRFADSIIVVSSDHGESFEKGYMGHSGDRLDDPLLHIPLVVHLPGQHERRTIDDAVSQADLMPTLTELAGARPPQGVEGRSLAPALHGAPLAPRMVFSMSMERTSRFAPLRRGTYAVIDWPLKLVHRLDDGDDQLYDLSADPHELNDLASARPVDRARLLDAIRGALKDAERRRPGASR